VAALLTAAMVGGCKKQPDSDEKQTAETGAPAKTVPAEQRQAAEREVQAVWSLPAVRGAVAEYAPAEADKAFYQDLVSLTRHPHRLAGYGAGAADAEKDEPGSLAAARYVENRLKMLGVDEVVTQSFPIVSPRLVECRLFVDQQEATAAEGSAIYPVRPNLLQASVTPAEGLSGPSVYAGDGRMPRYGELSPEGRIVVLEYDCEDRWLHAFSLGAKAVVFIGPRPDQPTPEVAWHHLNMPANLPRFYVPADVAEKLRLRENGRELKIVSSSRWTPLRGRNVVGIVRGTDPKLLNTAKDEADRKAREQSSPQAIVLAVPLDSYGTAPHLAQGARDAANIAALLDVARGMRENRPQRDILLCFFDAQALNHLGARAFYGALHRNLDGNAQSLEQRRERLEEEQAYWRDVQAIVATQLPQARQAVEALAPHRQKWAAMQAEIAALYAKAGPLTGDEQGQAESEAQAIQKQVQEQKADVLSAHRPTLFSETVQAMPRHRQAVRLFLSVEAQNVDSDILEELRPLRIRYADLKRQRRNVAAELEIARDEETRQAAQTNLAAIEQEMSALYPEIKRLAALDLLWNTAVRDLHGTDILPETREVFYELVKIADGIVGRRLEELQADIEQTNESLVLRNTVGPKRNLILLHLSLNLGDRYDTWTFVHGDDSGPMAEDPEGNYNGIYKTIRNTYMAYSAAAREAVSEESGEQIRAEAEQSIRRQIAGRDGPQRGALDEAEIQRRVDRLYKEEIEQRVTQRTLFDPRAVSMKYPSRLLSPGWYVDSGAIARIFSKFNLSVMTTLDPLRRQGHPTDTRQRLQPERILRQARKFADLGVSLLDQEGLIRKFPKPARPSYYESTWSNTAYRASGASVKRGGGGRAVADRPVRGAVVSLFGTAGEIWTSLDGKTTPPGFQPYLLSRTDMNGNFDVAPYNEGGEMKAAHAFAALMDTHQTPWQQESGAAGPGRGLISAVSSTKTLKVNGKLSTHAAEVFRTKFMTVVGYGYDRRGIKTIAMGAASTSRLREDRSLLCEWERVKTIFAPYVGKGVKMFNKEGDVLLNNTETSEGYTGTGVPLDDPFYHPVSVHIGARDQENLNSYRLNMLAENRIPQESLQIIHSQASGEREDAQKRETEDARRGSEAAAMQIERRVYAPLVEVIKDLVTAVVLLLLLAMPFAFALERLLIGTPHIYRQIGWFTLFFILTFLVLFFVNPAFRIASTPAIIFLAFSIILLSSLVIFIMVRKLQAEVKKMQGLATTVHSADVSRLSTMMAAVNMGISTMRRRPLRTFLTAATVILLTFTILTFASFGSSWGIRRTYEGPFVESNSTPRVLVRHQLWSPIGSGIYDTLRGHFTGRAVVVPRYWVAPTAAEAGQGGAGRPFEFLVADGERKQMVPLSAAIGLDYRDVDPAEGIKRQYQLRDILKTAPLPDGTDSLELLKTDGVFLTEAVAQSLGLAQREDGELKFQPGSPVILGALRLRLAGIVTEALANQMYLEGSYVRPVDYQKSGGNSSQTYAQQEQEADMVDVESATFVNYAADQVAIVSPRCARTMRGQIRSISIYPLAEVESRIPEMADDVARITRLPTYLGSEGGVYRLIFKSLAEASGWRDLMIPVLLGGLIIFATMLGSVSDREREIYTFSSLGLAPPHVASLFFAEASVYAVVGGMGGYLLGQVVARLLAWIGQMYPQLTIPSMNYSSTNAIVTILIVMSTVLISTIYPALKASRSANPGIQRSWRIPSPEGNLYDLLFPFTVSAYDITGVVSFLREHFDNFSDASLGVFATTECHVFRQQTNDMLGVHATVALAPFDLGVTQNFALLSQPSEIEGIDEVRILIYRLSGAQGDWKRANRVFINDLRKQLLIWRSLPHEVMDRYRQKTLEQWEQLPMEQWDPSSIGGSE